MLAVMPIKSGLRSYGGLHSLGISFEAKLKKEGAPTHLFTEKETDSTEDSNR